MRFLRFAPVQPNSTWGKTPQVRAQGPSDIGTVRKQVNMRAEWNGGEPPRDVPRTREEEEEKAAAAVAKRGRDDDALSGASSLGSEIRGG